MTKRKITVWWEIPCKSAIPVFEGLAEESDMDVSFISVYDLSKARKALGWRVNFNGSMQSHILSDDNWKRQINEGIADKNTFHIVNGFRQNERIKYLVNRLVETERRFGLAMEAPANLAMGWKRVVTSVAGPIVRRLRARKVIRHTRFVLSASGDKQEAFERLGFNSEIVFPFGYFPSFPLMDRNDTPATTLKIICIGFMEPFKGHEYLLRAIAELRTRKIPLTCIITGFGPTEKKLKALHKHFDLDDLVEFAGVVDSKSLAELFKWSNVLAAPGYEEPWGIRINEALLSGLPVVVSDGIGASELVEASGAGEVFKAGSYLSLADAFERYYTRISKNNDIFKAALRYRKRIEPRVAGHYVADVIRYVEPSNLELSVCRPTPPWLAQPSPHFYEG